MRLVAISDTHGMHRQVNVPDGDILIHAGDITMFGEFSQIEDFNSWADTLPHKYKVCIPGNHDVFREVGPEEYSALLENWIFLVNENANIEGLKIWGSPYTPEFGGPVWNYQLHGYKESQNLWKTIPDDTDVVVTHGPLKGYLDRTLEGDSVGDLALAQRFLSRRFRYHICGHIHEGYGVKEIREGNPTTLVNASICTRMYKPTNDPIVISI